MNTTRQDVSQNVTERKLRVPRWSVSHSTEMNICRKERERERGGEVEKKKEKEKKLSVTRHHTHSHTHTHTLPRPQASCRSRANLKQSWTSGSELS